MPASRLLTVTWSADLPHFELLRHSLALSRLAELPHDVIVQTEDLPLFERFAGGTVNLRASRDVLPDAVERMRLVARRRQEKFGRRLTTRLGSVSRLAGRPAWVRYTGWHTQQLCKLIAAAEPDATTTVILDSDVVVTRHASPADFDSADGLVCFADWQPASGLNRKIRRWQTSAHRLLDRTLGGDDSPDCQFDTPFVMHGHVVRALMQWLERRYQRPWWQSLLSLPPRGWSEFCIYKTYLRLLSGEAVDWQDTGKLGYLVDASDPARLLADLRRLAEEAGRHYVTVQSQSAGRQLWDASSYTGLIRGWLENEHHSAEARD